MRPKHSPFDADARSLHTWQSLGLSGDVAGQITGIQEAPAAAEARVARLAAHLTSTQVEVQPHLAKLAAAGAVAQHDVGVQEGVQQLWQKLRLRWGPVHRYQAPAEQLWVPSQEGAAAWLRAKPSQSMHHAA